jgi:undecaprenyl diphosphate synthase
MSLLRRYIIDERPTLMDNGVRLRTIGRVQELPDHVTEQIRITETMTAGNTGMVLALALNYGGHAEITDAVRALARKVRAGELDPDAIDESLIKANLYEPKMPPVDLLIRTGGEQRISNFLLWQVSYGELFVTPTLWPEFTEESLEEAVDVYWRRTRKFGGLLKGVDR